VGEQVVADKRRCYSSFDEEGPPRACAGALPAFGGFYEACKWVIGQNAAVTHGATAAGMSKARRPACGH